MPLRPAPTSRLLEQLARHQGAAPLARKLLVARTAGAGREVLRSLARSGVPWTGFEVTTLRPLALELALPALAADGLSVLDEFQEEALLDAAMDATARAGDAEAFRTLLNGPGFRRGVRGAAAALELAGVSPERLAAVPMADRARRDFLVEVLRRFQAETGASARVGLAEVLRRAARALENDAALRWDRVLLVPGLSLRGASGRLVHLLLQRGAETLAVDPVLGLRAPDTLLWRAHPEPAPLSALHDPHGDGIRTPPADAGSDQGGPVTGWSDLPLFADVEVAPAPIAADPVALDLFCAGGVEEELTEVIRRILASGAAWHDVEIVTPDPAAYGATLQGLAERLEIPVTFAVGLPVERTVPGRVVAAYLNWLREDFPASILIGLLARGDLRAPRPWEGVPGEALARALRRLRIGWGRLRYLPALDRAVLRARGAVEEAEGDARERAELRLRTHLALRALVHRLLDTTPKAVRDRTDDGLRVTPSALARGMRSLLGLLAVDGEVDETARDRLLRILDRAEVSLDRPAPLAAALATLEDHLAIRVPAPRAEGRAPWVSDAGSLHLSDLDHGGLSGRPRTFIVGLDAGRFPGSVGQDPFLLDRERRSISAALPTSGDRLEEARFEFAALLARLRGQVTLSHPVWDVAAARTLMPSPALLQAYRLRSGDPRAGFEALRDALGQPVSRVPRNGQAVDEQDLWIGALATESGFYEGTGAVRAAFPGLDRGLEAREAWAPGAQASVFTGYLPNPPEAVGRALEEPFSPTRLESLGACPLRFFLEYVARLRAPDDPEFAPDRWLDAARRGSLLHRVFESLLRAMRERDLTPTAPESRALAAELLATAVEEWSRIVPAPSTAVRDREAEGLRRDLLCFLGHLDGLQRRWEELELRFGFDEEIRLGTGEGALRIRGRIDRIDRTGAGDLVVVDYKTGRAGTFWNRATGTWRGGRRLQHLVYAYAAEAVLGGTLAGVEYHFPTERGEGVVAGFPRGALDAGEQIVARLLEGVRNGAFVPTDDAGDCRFCRYGPVCRVTEDNYGNTRSPAARFGKAALDSDDPAYRWMRAVRAWEEGT